MTHTHVRKSHMRRTTNNNPAMDPGSRKHTYTDFPLFCWIPDKRDAHQSQPLRPSGLFKLRVMLLIPANFFVLLRWVRGKRAIGLEEQRWPLAEKPHKRADVRVRYWAPIQRDTHCDVLERVLDHIEELLLLRCVRNIDVLPYAVIFARPVLRALFWTKAANNPRSIQAAAKGPGVAREDSGERAVVIKLQIQIRDFFADDRLSLT